MRRNFVVFLVLCVVCGASYWAYVRITASVRRNEAALDPTEDGRFDPVADMGPDGRVPVPNNRAPDVVDGFRGKVHPLLHRHTQTEVKAYWVPPNSDYPDLKAPLELRRLYTNVSAAVPVKSYSERDFSGFLPPDNVRGVGQLWALDLDRVAVFLTQFHPAVSTHSASVGRRPGPDGAFAVLRGVSSSYLDIVFRIHAEFDLLPKSSKLPVMKAWYSPACFLGRLVVNRAAGTVEYFQLGVPTDNTTNVHFTCWTTYGLHAHNTHRVDRMELKGHQFPALLPDPGDRAAAQNRFLSWFCLAHWTIRAADPAAAI